jgi:hypothetical protein
MGMRDHIHSAANYCLHGKGTYTHWFTGSCRGPRVSLIASAPYENTFNIHIRAIVSTPEVFTGQLPII